MNLGLKPMNAEIIAKLGIKSGIRPSAARPHDSALSVNHWIVQTWSVWYKGATNVLKHTRLLRQARQVLPYGVWGEEKLGRTGPSRSSGQPRRDSNHDRKRPWRTQVGRLATGNSARGGNRCGSAAFFSVNDERKTREVLVAS